MIIFEDYEERPAVPLRILVSAAWAIVSSLIIGAFIGLLVASVVLENEDVTPAKQSFGVTRDEGGVTR